MPNAQGTDSAGTLLGASGALGTVNALGNVAGGTTVLPAPSAAGITTLTLTANGTIQFPAPVAGQKITVQITQDGTGSRLGTFTATTGAVLFVGGSKTLTTTAGAIDRIVAESDGTNWYCSLSKAYA